MDIILSVFEKLHIDQSFFFQFFLISALYFVLKFLFLGKLQEVLELRTKNTSALDGEANAKFVQAEKIESEYKSKLDGAKDKIYQEFSEQKQKLTRKYEEELREAIDVENKRIQMKKEMNQKDINEQRERVLGQSQTLAKNLIDKLTK